jgi:hypothetical protein
MPVEAGVNVAKPEMTPALSISGSISPNAYVLLADELENGLPLCSSKKPVSTLSLLCRKKNWLALTRYISGAWPPVPEMIDRPVEETL